MVFVTAVSLASLVICAVALPVVFAMVRRTLQIKASMPRLPRNVVKYSQVPKTGFFTADRIPKGLLNDHSTKKGTWGIIRVEKGTLEYTIMEPTKAVFELQAPARGVIEPTKIHHVKALTDDLEFVVEFHRKPGTGPVDEKREGI